MCECVWLITLYLEVSFVRQRLALCFGIGVGVWAIEGLLFLLAADQGLHEAPRGAGGHRGARGGAGGGGALAFIAFLAVPPPSLLIFLQDLCRGPLALACEGVVVRAVTQDVRHGSHASKNRATLHCTKLHAGEREKSSSNRQPHILRFFEILSGREGGRGGYIC